MRAVYKYKNKVLIATYNSLGMRVSIESHRTIVVNEFIRRDRGGALDIVVGGHAWESLGAKWCVGMQTVGRHGASSRHRAS